MRPETVLIAVTPSAPPSRAEKDDGDVYGDVHGGGDRDLMVMYMVMVIVMIQLDTCSRNGDNVGDIGGHLGKDGHVR